MINYSFSSRQYEIESGRYKKEAAKAVVRLWAAQRLDGPLSLHLLSNLLRGEDLSEEERSDERFWILVGGKPYLRVWGPAGMYE